MDHLELAVARRTGRQRLGRFEALLLRLVLVAAWAVVVYVGFVTLAPPLAAWFGQYMGDAFKHTLEQTLPSPSPR